MRIDNHALTMFQTCPAMYHLRIIKGWVPRRHSAALGFGACIHEGLAEWYRTGSKLKSLQRLKDTWPEGLPTDDFRNLGKCLAVMNEYIDTYPAETWKVVGLAEGVPLIEKAFTLETGMFLPCANPTCVMFLHEAVDQDLCQQTVCPLCEAHREPLEYGGIIDLAVSMNGIIYVMDHKTTTRMGQQFFYKFNPDNQVTGYVWGCLSLTGGKVAGGMINGIGIYKSQGTKFERNITTRNAFQIDEWKNNVYATCCAIQRAKILDIWPMNTTACTLYGTCDYYSVHVMANAGDRVRRLEMDYKESFWDYEGRDDNKDRVG